MWNFISKDFVGGRRCDSSTGCQDVKREVASSDRDESDQDDDYMYESEEDDEELEYTSEVGSMEELSVRDTESSTSESEDASTGRLGVEVIEDIKSVERSASSVTTEILAPAAEPDRASDSRSSELTARKKDWDKCHELEHLAGPRCEHSSGYCGFNISAEEMKGCTTVQCLVKKTPEWTRESDDQDFELHDKYFLSGLCGQIPPRPLGPLKMVPPRHGAEYLYADTVLWNDEAEESSISMPFHPTCFEIFTRVSHLRTASVDVAGLMGWRRLESDYETDRSFPHHEAVKESHKQEWHHRRGDEWLAANPIVVPGLATVLRLAVSESNAFPKDDTKGMLGSEDPFSILPHEIADAILELLSPVEVAALRLAGCARYLAIESWYRQLREEMPWLWEVWDTTLPSFWATTTVSALSAEVSTLSAERKRNEEVERQWLAARDVIQQEMPEIMETWEMENEHPKEADSYAVCRNVELKDGLKNVMALPKGRTNWCRAYYEVKMNWEALRGLQNRERIWKDVEEIFRRIDVYRGEGRIG